MFNNVALDVFIGLVFVYLLYSLLATTINEFVSMIFAYRHRMLEKAIEQMLDGKNFSYYWWDKIANAFFWMHHRVNESPAQAAQITRKDFFRNRKVNPPNGNANNPQGNRDFIKRRKLNEKAALFAAKIINHPLYRRKSEQSILYKKPAYITASAFSDILFDVLSSRRSEINATPILMNDIKIFVSSQLKDNPGLKSILNMYIEQANGDVQKFKLLLEDWFDDSMDRVSGWYKRQVTKVLFVIGLILAVTFNVSTIDIVHKLSVNKDLREAMAKSASSYVENANKNQEATNGAGGKREPPKPQAGALAQGKEKSDDVDSSGGKPATGQNGAVNNRDDSAFAKAQQQIKNIEKLYTDTIAAINMTMGLGWDSSILYKNFERKPGGDTIWKVCSDSLNCFNKALQWLLPTWMFNGYYSSLSVLTATFSHPASIVGFLITALAITLGAPFWFDLLNKFVNVRAGGNKPSEDTTDNNKPPVSKNGTLNQKPASNSFA